MISSRPVRLRHVFALVLAAGLGCGGGGGASSGNAPNGNAFKDTYRSSLERWPSGEVSRLVRPTGKVEIVTSDAIEEDATRMMERGYLLLGRSTFRSEQVNPDAAREVAGDLGASVVLLKTQHATTVTEAIPIKVWAPLTPEEAPGATLKRSGGGATHLHGEFKSVYKWQSKDYYDYAATFWARSKPPILGVIVEGQGAPSPTGETGKGVVVRAVIQSSPASRGGVRRDDVIVRFAGTEVVTPDQFFDTVIANKGKKVEVEIVRVADSKQLKLELQLENE
jgi:hypothetical protein